MIIGNKADLTEKVIKKEAIEEYAKKNNILFMEASAKTNFQVGLAFQKISEKLMDLK